MGAYMTYLVTTKTTLPSFKEPEVFVRRRFSDFLGLYYRLAEKYMCLGYIVPPAPEKSVSGNFSPSLPPLPPSLLSFLPSLPFPPLPFPPSLSPLPPSLFSSPSFLSPSPFSLSFSFLYIHFISMVSNRNDKD